MRFVLDNFTENILHQEKLIQQNFVNHNLLLEYDIFLHIFKCCSTYCQIEILSKISLTVLECREVGKIIVIMEVSHLKIYFLIILCIPLLKECL